MQLANRSYSRLLFVYVQNPDCIIKRKWKYERIPITNPLITYLTAVPRVPQLTAAVAAGSREVASPVILTGVGLTG